MIDALGTPQRILLLGGTSDLGLSIVERLVPRDRTTDVILAGRDREALAASAAKFDDTRLRLRTIPFDAADVETHEPAIDAAWADGDVDVAIVAFGILGDQAALMEDPRSAAHLTNVNHTGAVSIGLHLAKRMGDQGHGHIIALSSIAAERARPANFIYGASKAGFDAFFDGLGYALAARGVTVSILRPGFVHTRMTAGLPVPPLASSATEVSHTAAATIGRTGVRYPSVGHHILGLGLRIVPRAVVRRLP